MTSLNAEAAADTIYRVLMSDEFQQFMLLEAGRIAQEDKDVTLQEYAKRGYPESLLEKLRQRDPNYLSVASEHISQITYMNEAIVRQMMIVMREQELIDERCLIIGDPKDLPLWPGATLTIEHITGEGPPVDRLDDIHG